MRTLSALAIALLMASPTASAADSDDRAASRRKAKDFEQEIIREIERGYYLKAGAGITQYLLDYSAVMAPVMGLNLAIGSDFVDRERTSMAWEIVFNQALHNGPQEHELAGLPPNLLVQGDIHTFAGLALLEVSTYPTRRLGLGVRGGGGVMIIPLRVYQGPAHGEGYDKIVSEYWGGNPSRLHGGPLPVVAFGPTLEYYTKLSHFSVGADVDVTYVLGFDLGVSPSGYLKYTF